MSARYEPDTAATNATTTVSGTVSLLLPRLGLLGVVFFGLAYMAPGIAISTFGVVSSASKGAAPTAYLIATGAMLLTAISYAVLAREYPSAGSAYTYAGKVLGPTIGFFAGWVVLLDYLFLPMVAWLIQAIYLNAQFPAIPVWAWLAMTVAATTVINLLGIALADRVNTALTVLAMASVSAVAIVMVLFLMGEPHAPASGAFWNEHTSIVAVSAAAAVAAYSFLGFDAISTLSEETKNAKKNIPRGIILTVLIGGAVFVLITFLMQWAHPGGEFEHPDTAGYQLSILAGGQTFANINNVVSLIAAFGSALAIQATSSRLLYVMGRDGALPRTIFGRLSNTFRVPWVNVLIIGVIGLFGALLDIEHATALINFGAFLAFALVNVTLLVWLWRTRDRAKSMLRRALFALLPLLGVLVDLYLFSKLHAAAFYVGLSWLGIGIVVFLVSLRNQHHSRSQHADLGAQ